MNDFAKYYEYSKLSSATYLDLNTVPIVDGYYATLGDKGLIALASSGSRLPNEQLAQNTFDSDTNQSAWRIRTGGYQGNTNSGFAGTLFERTNEQGQTEKVLAMRGTEPSFNTGLLSDVFQADLACIGIFGLAITQVVDMVNYIARLTAPAGQPVQILTLHYTASEYSGFLC